MPTTIHGTADGLNSTDSNLVIEIARSWHECNDYWKKNKDDLVESSSRNENFFSFNKPGI